MGEDNLSLNLVFVGNWGDADMLPDGTRILFGMTITAPERWAGQVRDIIMWPDGSVHLGADQRDAAERMGRA